MRPDIIVDSDIDAAVAVQTNPRHGRCPKHILDKQCLLTIHYIGFDGQLHRGQIVVHEDATTDVHEFFTLSRSIGFPIAKVTPLAHPDYLWDRDKTVVKDNLTYGFSYRTVHDTDRLSAHAYGLAIDVNPMQNPYIRRKSDETKVWPDVAWDPQAAGTLTEDNPLVKMMESHGWRWGGHKSRSPEGYEIVDYMHFTRLT